MRSAGGGAPLQEPSAWPVRGSQSHSEASMPPVASTAASGDHATHSTQPLCPCAPPARCMQRWAARRRAGRRPPRAKCRVGRCCQTGGKTPKKHHSQRFSQLAANARKVRLQRPRALQVCSGVCVARSHRRAVVSPLPLARWRPSGLKPTASTASVWPVGAPGLSAVGLPLAGPPRRPPTARQCQHSSCVARAQDGGRANGGCRGSCASRCRRAGPGTPDGSQAADGTARLGRAPHLPATRCSARPAARGTRPAAGTRCAARPPQTAARRRSQIL